MTSDRNPSNSNYRNEMDRESDAYSPVFNYNYRNGSDVESDSAYDLRREQEGSSQSDAIMGRRATEALEASRALDRSIRDQALAMENFDAAAGKVWAQEDKEGQARRIASLAAQNLRSDAYRRELTRQAEIAHQEQLNGYIYAVQMSGGARGGSGQGYGSTAAAANSVDMPQYDAAGNFTGMSAPVETVVSSSYADQMAHFGQVGIGALKSLPNVPSTLVNGLVDLAKLSADGYARGLNAAGVVSDESLGVVLDSKPWHMGLVMEASNRDQALGQVFGDVAWGAVAPAGVAKAVGYGTDLLGSVRTSVGAAEGAAAQAERAVWLEAGNAASPGLNGVKASSDVADLAAREKQGFELALGLQDHPAHISNPEKWGQLQRFAENLDNPNIKTYFDLAKERGFPRATSARTLESQIDGLMSDANHIHFNLDGVVTTPDATSLIRVMETGAEGSLIIPRNVTRWELNRAWSSYSDKSTFYFGGRPIDLFDILGIN